MFKSVLGILGVSICVYSIFLLSSQISWHQIIFIPELPILTFFVVFEIGHSAGYLKDIYNAC